MCSPSCSLVCERPVCKYDNQYSTCLSPEFYGEARHLIRRLFCQQPRRRIRCLARPKWVTQKYQPKTFETYRRQIQIYRPVEEPPTRIEQLAYTPARKLLQFKESVQGIFSAKRHTVLNRLIRKSLLSVYSRLANVQPPEKRKPTYKWTEDDWKKHTKHLKKLSRPKKLIKIKPKKKKTKPIDEMKRLVVLAIPKQREEFMAPQWELTKNMKKYKATDRIINLGKPKLREDNIHHQDIPWKVTTGAMKYKISPRIKALATPPEQRFGVSDLKENPWGIAPNALKARTSERTKELATPKEYEEVHTRADAFKISPNALKAKPSARIIELAKPKGA